MPRIPLTSAADPRVAQYAHLHQTNLTRGSRLFVAEGDKVVERLIDSNFEVDSILAEEAWADRLARRVPPETPIYVAPREVLTELVGFQFHRGVLACGRRKPTPSVDEIVKRCGDRPALVLVCPALQDPTNLGSIVRSAAALGASAVLLGSECADPFSRRVIRVSMGGVFFLPVRESPDLMADVVSLQVQGFEVLATVLDHRAAPLAQATRPQRLALVLGSEGHGLDDRWRRLCPHQVTLPMQAGIDSLNVSIAAAVFLYHFAQVAAAKGVP